MTLDFLMTEEFYLWVVEVLIVKAVFVVQVGVERKIAIVVVDAVEAKTKSVARAGIDTAVITVQEEILSAFRDEDESESGIGIENGIAFAAAEVGAVKVMGGVL